MAFHVGDIKIKGTYDGLSFYKSIFGWLVRQKGGPSRQQFLKSPSFTRARENSSEFAKCSGAASLLRREILQRTGLRDKTLYHRLMKLMRLLVEEDKNSARSLPGCKTAAVVIPNKDFMKSRRNMMCKITASGDKK